MTANEGKRSAVLMGDIVKSESSQPFDIIHNKFNKSISQQNKKNKENIVSPLTITLGDEFQGLIDTLSHAAEIARNLRLDMLSEGINCRFVIGLVEIETPVNKEKAWNMMGPGLSRARDKLNNKKSGQFYRFSIETQLNIETMLDALGAGISVIERSWTDQQRDDISALLSGLSPTELAKKRNVSVHSIYKVRGSGEIDAYTMQWNAIFAALNLVDKNEKLK